MTMVSEVFGLDGVLFLIMPVLALALYLVPTIVVLKRKGREPGPVVVINLLLGWTFIGWVVALAMAFGERPDQHVYVNQLVGHPTVAAAGWYDDPDEPGEWRWWDGHRWAAPGMQPLECED